MTGYDLRGFGASGGRRAWADAWDRHHDDLEERLAAIRNDAPDRPVVLYGHSMGALVALGYVVAAPARPLPDVLVLSAPGDRFLAASLAEDGCAHPRPPRADVRG